MNKNNTIFVGLSGGVDSSVSAKRLLDAGYTVVGVFIKTWQPDFLTCKWEAERLDAMRVSAHLGIPFRTFDAEIAYKDHVAKYMIEEYKNGRTPNPDVMCNQHVKFGAFLEYAKAEGAQGVATGHYARVTSEQGRYRLFRGIDTNKDQSYFLWTLTQEQLSHIHFPVGDTEKSTVRKEAEDASIPTFAKNDSQGVCFLGQIDMKEFLSHYVTVAEGAVLDEQGAHIGTHDGALFYTIGQRHGFTIGTTKVESSPHYVVSKDMHNNTLTVSPIPRTSSGKYITLSQVNTIRELLPKKCSAQFRYRQKPFTIEVIANGAHEMDIFVCDNEVGLPSVGQSCVLYDGDECLGGGIIDTIRDTVLK